MLPRAPSGLRLVIRCSSSRLSSRASPVARPPRGTRSHLLDHHMQIELQPAPINAPAVPAWSEPSTFPSMLMGCLGTHRVGYVGHRFVGPTYTPALSPVLQGPKTSLGRSTRVAEATSKELPLSTAMEACGSIDRSADWRQAIIAKVDAHDDAYLRPSLYDSALSTLFPDMAPRIATGYGRSKTS